jgi:large subunit ribosomal protein L19
MLKKAVAYSIKDNVPEFSIGDTVNVHVRIVEGSKERIQRFTGTVIARKGSGISETFTVRRIVNNRGIERVFPVHSPNVADIEVVRGGKIRRAKLYYLRDRVGKATRLKDVIAGTRKDGEPVIDEDVYLDEVVTEEEIPADEEPADEAPTEAEENDAPAEPEEEVNE